MHLKHKTAAAILAVLAMAASAGVDAAPQTAKSTHHARSANQGMQAPPSGGDCDPLSDWVDLGTTNYLLPGSFHAHVSGNRSMRGAAAQVIGTTPEQIHRNFMHVVTQNLANAGTATRVARLSDRELSGIAGYAQQATPAERAKLLKLFAQRLDGRSLMRIARAFGRAPTEAAVHAYAGKTTREAFDGQVAGFRAPPPEGGGGGTGGTSSTGGSSYPRPNLNMTLKEIYLEFRTAPVGSLSPSAAFAETAMYAGGWLYASWKVGNWVGDGFYDLISTYDPDLDAAIGGIVANVIENMWLATDAVEDGHYEAALDDLFGLQVTRSSDPWGDWDISAPMINYYNWSGTCGY
jgi:hypothetical protein